MMERFTEYGKNRSKDNQDNSTDLTFIYQSFKKTL